MIGRSTEIWRGKTPDTPIPPRVKLRIWEREGGRCYLTGKKIRPGDKWEYEHRIALTNGGSHSEDNIFLALTYAHRVKTAADVAERAKVDRVTKYHLGIKKPTRPLPGGRNSPWKIKMNGEVVRRDGA